MQDQIISTAIIETIREVLNRRFRGYATLGDLVTAILEEAGNINDWGGSVWTQIPAYLIQRPELGLGVIIVHYHHIEGTDKTFSIYQAR